MLPLPGTDGALSELPPSLIKLNLGDLELQSTELLPPRLPSLTHLTLSRCGLFALTIAEALLADKSRCPRLQRSKCFIGSTPYEVKCLEPKATEKAGDSATSRPSSSLEGQLEGGSRPSSSMAGQMEGQEEGEGSSAMELDSDGPELDSDGPA